MPQESQFPQAMIISPEFEGKRVDRFLKKRYPKLGQGLLQKFLRNRKITRDGKKLAANDRLEAGDTLELWRSFEEFEVTEREAQEKLERRKRSRGFEKKFRPIFEDEYLVALNKSAGQVVHPAQNHHHGDTLLDLLMLHLPQAYQKESPYRPGFVHRLDQGTSGILIAAKTREAARQLEASFREQQVKKVYLTLVKGSLKKNSGTISLEIGRKNKASGKTKYWAVGGKRSQNVVFPKPGSTAGSKNTPQDNFKEAITRYEVLEKFKGLSLLKVDLGTGRTHQIRVHFSAIGHPVIGDGDYGDKALNQKFRQQFQLERLFLHAHEIEFPHPSDGTMTRLTAPLPFKLKNVIKELKKRV